MQLLLCRILLHPDIWSTGSDFPVNWLAVAFLGVTKITTARITSTQTIPAIIGTNICGDNFFRNYCLDSFHIPLSENKLFIRQADLISVIEKQFLAWHLLCFRSGMYSCWNPYLPGNIYLLQNGSHSVPC